MSVLSVARDQSPSAELRLPTGPPDTNDQSDEGFTVVDVADRLSRAIEEFVSGLLPGKTAISVDWGTLSPIFSTLGSLSTLALAAVRWL